MSKNYVLLMVGCIVNFLKAEINNKKKMLENKIKIFLVVLIANKLLTKQVIVFKQIFFCFSFNNHALHKNLSTSIKIHSIKYTNGRSKKENRKLKTDRRFEQHFIGVNAVMKQVKCEQLKGTFD